MKKLFLIIFLAIVLVSCEEDSCPPLKTDNEKVIVKVGVIVSETGPVSEVGKTAKAAFELAVEDMKKSYSNISQNVEFVYEIVDDQADANLTLNIIKQLHEEKGFNIFFGINTSSAVKSIKQYADKEDLLILSTSSTSKELAIANDNIFRYVPSDNLMAKACSKLSQYHELECVVPVARDDIASTALANSMEEYLDMRSISHTNMIKYNVLQETSTAIVEKIRSSIVDALKTHQSNKIGVFIAGFEEYIALFELFKQEDLFKTVKWYGADGTYTGLLFQNPTALAFAKEVNFCVVTLGNNFYNSDEYLKIATRIKEKTNGIINPYGLSAYDAAVCLIKSIVQTSKNPTNSNLKNEFISQSEKYYGVTGWCKLNIAGDRTEGFYDFYKINDESNAWKVFYSYETQYDVLFDNTKIK